MSATSDQHTIPPPTSIQSPSSTITPTHFQHKTTDAAPSTTMIDTATPAINAVPIELDSTPITHSPPGHLTANDASIPSAAAGQSTLAGLKDAVKSAVKGTEQKINQALGSSGMQDSSKLRAHDAAVMAGPPGTPGPEEFRAAAADGAVTPSGV